MNNKFLKNENGNILFLILIAVALFAALSYAVTSSTRGGSSGTNKEKADLTASEILNYTNNIRAAHLRLKMNGNMDSTSYDRPDLSSPSVKNMFSPTGGGVSFIDPDGTTPAIEQKGWALGMDASSNDAWYGLAVVENLGSEAADEVLIVSIADEAVCKTINKNLISEATIPTGQTAPASDGSVEGNIDGDTCTKCVGQQELCVAGGDANSNALNGVDYFLYTVLAIR